MHVINIPDPKTVVGLFRDIRERLTLITFAFTFALFIRSSAFFAVDPASYNNTLAS